MKSSGAAADVPTGSQPDSGPPTVHTFARVVDAAAMDTRTTLRLHTGREIPIIGLGTWQLTRDTAGAVEQALALGYRMIDTSGDYGTQPGVGEGIRRSGLPRDESSLVTKVGEDADAYEATRRNPEEFGLD